MSYLNLQKNLSPFLSSDSFFVNIGANDGISNDPIYPFLKKYNLAGIAIEPLPYTFKRLKHNLAEFNRVIFENIAIANEDITFFYFSEELMKKSQHNLSQWTTTQRDSIETFIELFEKGETVPELVDIIGYKPSSKELLDNIIVDTSIPSITFNALMEKHSVEKIDFINIDVEGLDLELLLSIDMERYSPKILCIETQFFKDDPRLKIFLEQYDYRHIQHFGLVSEIYLRD